MQTTRLHFLLRGFLCRGIFKTLAGLLFGFATVSAQPAPSDDEVDTLSPFEVVSGDDYGYRKTNAITAMRIGAPIIETPLNISVISRELLEDLGTRNTNQMFYYTASVKTSFDAPSNALAGSEDTLKIRGFGTSFVYQDNFRRTKAFHIDGMDRTEIVKGPNGLYFGRTNPGGIINFISKKPNFIRAGDVTLTLGNDKFYKGVVDWQDVLIPNQLAYRLVGSLRDSEDWFDETFWYEEYFLGSVKWTPVPVLEIDFQFEYFNQNRDGGRVGAIVANERYLAAALGGQLQVDANGNPETQGQYRTRIFNETGVNIRSWDSFWFPRGFTTNRNGRGSFDDNLSRTYTIDGRWQINPDLDVRFAYNYIDDNNDISWFINQDPHQSPNIFATFANGGQQCFTCINYGFFQVQANDPFGGNAPGRQWNDNNTHSFQLDGTYSFRAFNARHTFIGSLEYIQDEYTRGGYQTDPNRFVAAGGIPAGSNGLTPVSWLDAQHNQMLFDRHAQFVAMGLLNPGQAWNPGLSQLMVNLADPSVPVPNMKDWLVGRTPQFAGGSDSIDRSVSLAYRGEYMDRRLIVLAGARRQNFKTIAVDNAGNNTRSRRQTGWESFYETLPTVGANFYVTPELVAYASFSRTYRPVSGLINPIYTNIETGQQVGGEALVPEKGEGWEIGIKTNFRESMWSGTFTYFELSREDLVISNNLINAAILNENEARFEADPNAVLPWVNENGVAFLGNQRPNQRNNGGVQASAGFEFDLIYTPMPNFQAIFSFMHFTRPPFWKEMDANLINVNRGGNFVGVGNLNDGTDAVPAHLDNNPRNQFGIWGKYTFVEGALRNLSLGFGGNYQDGEIHEVRPNGSFTPFTTGHHWRFDGMVRYETQLWDNPLAFHLSVNNVFDKEIISGTFGVSPTREWSLSARYRF